MTQIDAFPQTRGIRNHNPGNIRSTGKLVFMGEMAPDVDGFCRFSLDLYGIRAMMKIFNTYQEVDKLYTVATMIARWAPRGENDTNAYIADVAHRAALLPDSVLTFGNVAIPFTRAVVFHENGFDPYHVETYSEALRLSNLR